MWTAFLEARFSDLAQQLAVLAGSLHGATATTRTAPGRPAGTDAKTHRGLAPARAQRRAANGTSAPGAAAAALDSSAAARACDDVVIGARPAGDCSRPTSPRRAALARLAQDYLEANLDQSFSLRQLGEMARCSERMLQYAFRDIYGMGPHAWFQAMKLREANRELRTGRSRSLRVSDVALRWGFTHFGRFSGEYRRMFGESPSETLRRGSQTESTRQDSMPGKQHRAGEARSEISDRAA
jgi:AraC-like DNA-binding protein